MSGVRRNPSPEKLGFARKMAANPTDFEKQFWPRLRRGIKGAKFTTQAVMGGYILDFYCDELRLAVELDGYHHDIHYDSNRDSQLYSTFGITVMRYSNPKSEAAITAILFAVQAECRWRLGRIKRGLFTFQQHSSLTTEKDKTRVSTTTLPVETCEYVEKNPGFRPSSVNLGCTQQVYANLEVARNAVRNLRALGIDATVERCPSCKLIHLIEKRPTQ